MTYRQRLDELPRSERAALDKLLAMVPDGQREAAREAARELARMRRKRRLNAASDRERRVLVGARVPREEALAIELAARERGVSVYRFVRDALLAAAGCAPPSLGPGGTPRSLAQGRSLGGETSPRPSFGGRAPGGLGESSTYQRISLRW